MELRPIKLAKRILGIQHGGWNGLDIVIDEKNSSSLSFFKYRERRNDQTNMNNDNKRDITLRVTRLSRKSILNLKFILAEVEIKIAWSKRLI